MILNRSIILVVNLHNELQELALINFLSKSIHFNNGSRHCWHLHRAADDAREFKNVELKCGDARAEVLVLIQDSLDIFGGNLGVSLGRISKHLACKLKVDT